MKSEGTLIRIAFLGVVAGVFGFVAGTGCLIPIPFFAIALVTLFISISGRLH